MKRKNFPGRKLIRKQDAILRHAVAIAPTVAYQSRLSRAERLGIERAHCKRRKHPFTVQP